MTIRNALTEEQLKSLYIVIFVTNAIEPNHELIRGIVHMPVFPDDATPQSIFFGQINQSVLEYENLPPWRVNTELSPGAAMQRAIHGWPEFVTIVATNTQMWMRPIINDIKENTTWFVDRDIHVVDLAQFVDCKEHQIFDRQFVEDVLPPCVWHGRSGSMSKLLSELDVRTGQINDPIYAVKRAKMLKEGVLKALDRELQSNSKTEMS